MMDIDNIDADGLCRALRNAAKDIVDDVKSALDNATKREASSEDEFNESIKNAATKTVEMTKVSLACER